MLTEVSALMGLAAQWPALPLEEGREGFMGKVVSRLRPEN